MSSAPPGDVRKIPTCDSIVIISSFSWLQMAPPFSGCSHGVGVFNHLVTKVGIAELRQMKHVQLIGGIRG